MPMPNKKNTSRTKHREASSNTDFKGLEDEFGFISEDLSKLPPPAARFRGGKDAWTEMEDWLRLEGLLR